MALCEPSGAAGRTGTTVTGGVGLVSSIPPGEYVRINARKAHATNNEKKTDNEKNKKRKHDREVGT